MLTCTIKGCRNERHHSTKFCSDECKDIGNGLLRAKRASSRTKTKAIDPKWLVRGEIKI